MTEPLQCVPISTFNTPQRSQRARIESGNVSSEVVDRMINCTGFPFHLIREVGSNAADQRKICYFCKSKTAWKCLKCKFYFCMKAGKNSKRDPKLYSLTEKNKKNKEVTTVYAKTCYHRAHHNAIMQEFSHLREVDAADHEV